MCLTFGIATSVAAQPVVKLRNLEKAPGAGYEIQTDANGKASWGVDAGGAITVNLTPIAYVPAATGNSSNLNQAVIDLNSDIWIIDENGTAVKINSGSNSAAWSSITGIPAGFADGIDNTADGDSDATNEIQNSNEVPLNTNLVINGGIVTTTQEALEALATLQEKQQLAINETTLSITDGQGNVVNSVGLPAGGSGTGTDDQVASEVAVTPAAGISSTDVQAALEELSTEVDSFDFNRPVLRVPEQGDTIGGNTYEDYFDFLYFAPPNISLAQSPSTTLIEIGSTQQYTFTATTSNPGSATLSAGHLFVVSGDTLDSYTSTTTGAATIDFTPKQTPVDTFDSYVYQVRATQSWNGGGESGTATSNTRTFRGAYPIFHGVIPVADTAIVYGDIYGSSLNKDIELEGDKDITFNYAGTDGIAVYGFPASWSDNTIDQILDPNNLNATGGFVRRTDITVTSTGLNDNYTSVPYVFYVAGGVSSYSSATYQFNQ